MRQSLPLSELLVSVHCEASQAKVKRHAGQASTAAKPFTDKYFFQQKATLTESSITVLFECPL